MFETNSSRIHGSWRKGYTLDAYSFSSRVIGYDDRGQPEFDTKYSKVGELLHELKYDENESRFEELMDYICCFIYNELFPYDAIVPVPFTKVRQVQPVLKIASHVSWFFDIPVSGGIVKTRTNKQLKGLSLDEKRREVDAIFHAEPHLFDDKKVLVIDDIFETGTTLNAACEAIKLSSRPKLVDVLAVARVIGPSRERCKDIETYYGMGGNGHDNVYLEGDLYLSPYGEFIHSR